MNKRNKESRKMLTQLPSSSSSTNEIEQKHRNKETKKQRKIKAKLINYSTLREL